ncbi:sensor histidine kinase [Dactylosporangium sp. CA-139066]|uniref:sensor histidine kinase n=1 Tax=Dactylosporangium sp. CA-139066 TaxID=3239930 RepID=UPI003D947B34
MERGARLIRRAGSTPGDAASALALLLAAVVLGLRATDPFPYGVLAAAATMAWRRRFPTAACAVTGAGLLATFPWPVGDAVLLLAVACLVLACYAAAVHARHSWLGPAILAAVVAPFAGGSRFPVPDAAVPFLVLGSAWLAGAAARSRARSAAAWRAEAGRAARERDEAYASAVRDERARIARELHDVVTHRVSVMVIAAGAARTLLPADPGRAAEQLRLVEAGGRDALGDLRGMLGLLATVPYDAGVQPQPGLAMLPDLVAGVSAAGLPVTCRVTGETRPLPPGLGLAAYRIVQEALTNSLRYSTRAGTRISVDIGDEALALAVVDDQPPPAPHPRGSGGGRGLIGIRERVASYGGSVAIDDDPARPFAVSVRIPIPDAGSAP